jgi:hypothetical protein
LNWIDCLSSPSLSILRQAKAAVTHLVSHATRCDPDGISLYFFSTNYDKHENMSSADDVMALFETHQPGGGTKLAKVFILMSMPSPQKRRNLSLQSIRLFCLPRFIMLL